MASILRQAQDEVCDKLRMRRATSSGWGVRQVFRPTSPDQPSRRHCERPERARGNPEVKSAAQTLAGLLRRDAPRN